MGGGPPCHDLGDATLKESPACRTEPGTRGGTGGLATLPVVPVWMSQQGIGLAMEASVLELQALGDEWG